MNEKRFLLIGGLFYLGLSFFTFRASSEERAHKPMDAQGYHAIAMRFVEKGTLLSESKEPLNHPIGYSLLLGLFYKLWGSEIWKLVQFQVLLMLMSLVVWYYIVKRLFGENRAYYAYLFSIFNLGFLLYPQLVLVEVGQFFLCTLFFERLSRFYCSSKEQCLTQAGLCLGLSVWLKPSALYFPLYCIPFVLGLWLWKRTNILYNLFCFAGGFYVPVMFYSLYNYMMFGYVRISYIPEYAQYFFFHKKLLHQINPAWSESKLHKLLYSHFDSRYIRLDSRYWKSSAQFFYQTCFSYPLLVSEHIVLNIIKTLTAPFTSQWKLYLDTSLKGSHAQSFFQNPKGYLAPLFTYSSMGLITLYGIVYSFFQWICMLLGCWILLKTRKELFLLFGFMIAGYFSLITFADGGGRYRLIFEPLYISSAAIGFVYLREYVKILSFGSFTSSFYLRGES